MRTENEFNRKLGQLFKKQKGLFFRKLADKYQAGISDFLLAMNNKTIFIECKFKKTLDEKLKHKFSGPQISFLRQYEDTGGEGYGLIGVESENMMYLIHANRLKEPGVDVVAATQKYPLNDAGVKAMLVFLLGEYLG